MDKLRFASDREAQASSFLEQNAVRVTSDNIDTLGTQTLQGEVRHKNQIFLPVVTLDRDLRIVHAECTCNWHQQNKLFKGPCEHILSMRMHSDRMATSIV